MGTRSRIGRENEDGSVTSIYCHWDGYIDGVGMTLLDHYKEPAKVRSLIALGDLSCLRASVHPEEGKPHDFDGEQQPEVTIAYKRDRGDKDVDPITHPKGEWPDFEQEYLYLFTQDREWMVVRGGQPIHGWKLLTPEVFHE
jgi:hypothetical protein